MKTGDLVSMNNYCGGSPGAIRCDVAIVLDVWLSHHEQVQVDSQTYRDKDVYECSLVCKCGTFQEYADELGMVNESR